MSNSDAILKRISKKTKIGEYDPVEVIEALNMVEPGWTIEPATSTMQASGYSNQKDRFEKVWGDALGLDTNDKYSTSFTDVPAGMDPISIHSDSLNVGFAESSGLASSQKEKLLKDILLTLEKPLTKAKTLPAKPAVDGLYFAGFKVENGYRGYRVELVKPRLGVPAWTIKSPGGEELVLPVQPPSRGVVGDPRNMTAVSLWTWLYKETDADQKAKAYLDTPEIAQKTERQDLLKSIGDKVGRVGTCCICENHQVLDRKRLDQDGHPTMVKHGYQRPGVGYLIGECFGVGWAPYELSPKACEAWRDRLVDMIANQKQNIKDLKAVTEYDGIYVAIVDYEYAHPDEFEKVVLFKSGKISSLGETKKRTELPRGEPVFTIVKGKEAQAFESMKKKDIGQAEAQLGYMEDDHKTMVRKIKDWTEQPLPGTSKDDTAQIEQMKSKLCPGSGTTNHDASHTGRNYSWWAKCNVCGQQVTVNKSSNKMRAHAPAKVKAMTASVRMDAVAEKLLTLTTPEKVQAAVEEAADLLAKLT